MKIQTKKVIEIKDEPRINILNIEPGDISDTFQMRKAQVQDYLLDKGGYLYIERTKNKFKSLRYVDAENFTINTNFDLRGEERKLVIKFIRIKEFKRAN